mgnify:CR=1 FL=1
MAKVSSSPEQPQPLRAVVGLTKSWVERLGSVWVAGQLVELRRRSGAVTHFISLRDPLAAVTVTVTASTSVLDAAGPIGDGMEVVAFVRPTVWAARGSLTFECTDLRPSGEGRLLAQIEQRKRTLQAEGLFDPARKRRLPFLPRGVGLITAEGSAAERDVLEVARRRWSGVRFVVRHALMQGQGCVEQIRDALTALDRDPSVDVIIVARGGGSLQDLLPFSDESLVRAVFACHTPVVSAIGHEPDTPIIDLVADLRAATPTDAAKRVVPDVADERDRVNQARDRVRAATLRLLTSTSLAAHLFSRKPTSCCVVFSLCLRMKFTTSCASCGSRICCRCRPPWPSTPPASPWGRPPSRWPRATRSAARRKMHWRTAPIPWPHRPGPMAS